MTTMALQKVIQLMTKRQSTNNFPIDDAYQKAIWNPTFWYSYTS